MWRMASDKFVAMLELISINVRQDFTAIGGREKKSPLETPLFVRHFVPFTVFAIRFNIPAKIKIPVPLPFSFKRHS